MHTVNPRTIQRPVVNPHGGKMLVENKKLLPVEESWVLAEGQRAASSIYEDYKAGKSGKCWEDEK